MMWLSRPVDGRPSLTALNSSSRVFVVVDLDVGRTVTNAASDVVSELPARHGPLAAPLIYRDTLGRWDGMTVRSGRFAGYYPLAESYEEARKVLHRMIEDHDPRLGDALPPLDMLSDSRCSAAGKFVGSANETLLAIGRWRTIGQRRRRPNDDHHRWNKGCR